MLLNSKENVETDTKLQQKPIEQADASDTIVQNAHSNANKNDNGTGLK